MQFIYDDGGRARAGYRGSTGDCVARAIAIAAEMPYEEVYQRLASGHASQRITKHSGRKRSAGKRTAAQGIYTQRKWFKDFMAAIGFEWTPTMKIGSGCKVHLTTGELPLGRLIVAVSKHYTCVIDGVIHDTYSPEREIAEFRQFPGWRECVLKPGEQRNENGVFTYRRRCVYGYWRLVE